MSEVIVYGTNWSDATKETIAQLDGLGVHYQYVDIEKDPHAAEIVRRAGNGEEHTPTVDVLGGLYVEPSEAELGFALRASGLMA